MIAAWIAVEILRWTSEEGCARAMLQAATRTARELAEDKSTIIRSRRNSPCDRDYLYHSLMFTPLVAHPENTQEGLTKVENKLYALRPSNVTSNAMCGGCPVADRVRRVNSKINCHYRG
jgi:hypothetical protein